MNSFNTIIVEPWLQGAPSQPVNSFYALSRPSYLGFLPLYLSLLLVMATVVFYIYSRRSKKVGILIPATTCILSIMLLFIYFIPIPLKEICYSTSLKESSQLNCNPVKITIWNRILETYGSTHPVSKTQYVNPNSVIKNPAVYPTY